MRKWTGAAPPARTPDRGNTGVSAAHPILALGILLLEVEKVLDSLQLKELYRLFQPGSRGLRGNGRPSFPFQGWTGGYEVMRRLVILPAKTTCRRVIDLIHNYEMTAECNMTCEKLNNSASIKSI